MFDKLKKQLTGMENKLPNIVPSSDELLSNYDQKLNEPGNFTKAQLQPSMFDDELDKARQFAVKPENFATIGSVRARPLYEGMKESPVFTNFIDKVANEGNKLETLKLGLGRSPELVKQFWDNINKNTLPHEQEAIYRILTQ